MMWLAPLAFLFLPAEEPNDLIQAVRKFAEDRNTVAANTWRLLNEVPTVLMIGIVILVVVKPF